MFKRQYFFILFVLKICTGGIANYTGSLTPGS